jgi:O-antigen/teichoic acid export membrane protein
MTQKNILVNYLGNAWTALMGFIFIPIYISYLGIESYGLIGLFIILQGLLSLLDMGLSPTLNREMARFRAGVHTPESIGNLLRSVEIVYLLVAVFIFSLIFSGSSFIASDWLKIQNLEMNMVIQALKLMGLILAIRWIGIIYRSAITGLQEHVWLTTCMVFFATIRGIGAIVVLEFISPTIQAFFIFQAAVVLTEVIVLVLKTKLLLPKPKEPVHFSVESLKHVWKFAGGMMLITFLATLLTQVDKVLLSTLLPLAEFGYFSIAVTIAGILSLLIAPIDRVAFPHFTQLISARNKKEYISQYHKFSQLMTIMIVPATLILSFFSKEVVFLWSHNEVLTNSVAPIMSIWVIGTALNGIMHMPYVAQLSYGWSRLTIVVNAFSIIVIIPLLFYLVPLYGALSAAWIWVGINVGYVLVSITYMHKKILKKEKWEWYINDLFIPTFLSLAVVILARKLLDDLMISNLFLLALYICLVAILALSLSVISTKIGRSYISNLKQRYFYAR